MIIHKQMKVKKKFEINLNMEHLWGKLKVLFNIHFKMVMMNYCILLKLIIIKKNRSIWKVCRYNQENGEILVIKLLLLLKTIWLIFKIFKIKYIISQRVRFHSND